MRPTIVLAYCALALTPLFAQTQPALEAILDKHWQHELQVYPEFATAIGDNRYNDRITDLSAASIAAEFTWARKILAELQAVSEAGLTADNRLNRDLMVRQLQLDLAGEPFRAWEMPVTQMGGPHLDYASFPTDMPFLTGKDYENYWRRLLRIPTGLQQTTANMRLGMRDGLMPPRYIVQKVREEVLDIANKPLADNPFTAPLRKWPESVGAADRRRWSAAIKKAVSAQVLPAYAAFARFIQDEYEPRGREEYGIWSLPQSPERYRHEIEANTTTHSDPEQLHALGLEQVEEIEVRMLAIAKSQGFADLKSFNAHLFADAALHGKSGQQILELYSRYTDQMYAKLPQYFGRLPKNKLVVRPMEAYRAPHEVPADYSIGAGDGSRPGRINVNEYEPAKRLLLNVEAIAYHEGIPGHHLQFSIAQEVTGLPPFRKFAQYNAFSEGWALYAETLSREMGFYQDPYSEYGRLQNLMWRSIRLVVDTGVHAKHWSRQQMIDFFHAHSAMDDQNIETEVDRYIAWPGQALGYKLGEMTILRLREQAKRELGAAFDIRKFHDAVLERGPLPLDVLDAGIQQWIGAQRQAKP